MTVLDLDDAKINPLIKAGAVVAATPKEIAEQSTLVFSSLQPNDVEKVACGANGIAESNKVGLVFVDLSSTAPELAIKVSDALRAHGIEMLDAPLSGADVGATNGDLTIFVGGIYAAYQRALPVLQQVGRLVTYLGKNGNGQIGKRINQMMQALSELAIYEGLLLAKKSGLDLKMFARPASGGCAESWRLDELLDNVFNKGDRTYKLGMRPGRTGNALKMPEKLGLDLAGARAAEQIFSRHSWQVEIDFDKDDIPEPV
jgi:3-hydroxyisobutyrate dehydrogenase-like beta-hydroxyacid dehydrogenase